VEVAVQAPTAPQVTALLQAWSSGDRTALDRLVPLVHAELRRLARRYMRRERAGHTLQTTALIHEAYIRLVDAESINWQNRAHFFGISARVMRRVLSTSLASRDIENAVAEIAECRWMTRCSSPTRRMPISSRWTTR
jgi:RNA polymerase sigma factor (TIGR02999 family)